MSARKLKVSRILKTWVVTCDFCGDDFMSMFPWITAGNHATALTLAAWHLAEHRARSCDHCHRTDPLPKPQFVDPGHVNFDGKLYEIRSTGVVAIGTAASKANA